ncbi:MAG TPA: PfkB family carbohydrate kinase [Polyangia bacterium]|jgi:sugar/nucleoside kinase (ribokinase family)|nr:PfkB family carbohydrate kinase [Polyangia bacterium]
MDLLVLGHVTRDEIADELRLGGAASYAALAAARLGFPTTLVTIAPPDDPLLAPLRAEPGLTLHCVPSPVMTTFRLAYRGGRRRLALRQVARALVSDDLPARWRRGAASAAASPGIAYVGPVAGECDGALIATLGARFVAVGLQGWLRAPGAAGVIEPALACEAIEPPRLDVAILSEADHPDAEAIAERFLTAGALVAITRGARGATLRASGAKWEIAAAPAVEVDPTGAGDVFGVVLALALAAGQPPPEAGAAAARAAARVVEGPGLGRLG